MKIRPILLAVLTGALSLAALGTFTTPLNRAFLQSNLNGNGYAGTNFGIIRSTNFIDAATGLPLSFGGSSTNFGVVAGTGLTASTQSSAGLKIVTLADAYAKQPAHASLTNLTTGAANNYVGAFTGNVAGATNLPFGALSSTAATAVTNSALAGINTASNSITANITNLVAGKTAGLTNLVAGTSNSITANLTNLVSGKTSGLTNLVTGTSNSLAAQFTGGIPTLNGFGTNIYLVNPTLTGVQTNNSLVVSGTITRTNYTTGIRSVESAADHLFYPAGSTVPNLNLNGTSGDVSTVGTFYGNGAGLTNLAFDTRSTNFTAYADGTAYSLTATPAALDFGTTDPAMTLLEAGTYTIRAKVGVKFNGSTYGTTQTATLKLRRTNNTAADLSNGSRAVTMPILTTFTGGSVFDLPEIVYTATAGDQITIFGSVSATPSAGSVDTDSAEIVAQRIY